MMKMRSITKTVKHKKSRGKVVSYFSMRFRQVLLLCLAFCLLLFAGAAPRQVLAQAAATVSFSPTSAVIDTRVGNTTVVDVVISNAVNIGGFSIQINYDPNVARISRWAPGNFFADAICLTPVDIPGSLQVDCAKIGNPGNNGSGRLAELTFEAVAWGGNSPLNFGIAQLVDSDTNQFVDVVVAPGELSVIPYHIALPLIFKQGGPQSLQVPAETLAQTQTIALHIPIEFPLALGGCDEAQS